MIRRALLRVAHTLTGHHRRYLLASCRPGTPVRCFGCHATLPLPGRPLGLGPAALAAWDDRIHLGPDRAALTGSRRP